jgi:hypothetical protein
LSNLSSSSGSSSISGSTAVAFILAFFTRLQRLQSSRHNRVQVDWAESQLWM